MITNNFINRHNGPDKDEAELMLKAIGVHSLDQLIDETIPASIMLPKPLNLPAGLNEFEYLNHIKALSSKNKVFKSYIGMGYYNTITPGVILRNIFENPGLVHLLHTLPGRDIARPTRSIAYLSNDGFGSDWDASG